MLIYNYDACVCCSIPAYPNHCKKFIQSLCFFVISITIAIIINFAFSCILLAWVNRNVYCGSCNVYPQQNRMPLASLRPRPNSLIKVLELFNLISFQGCSLYNVFLTLVLPNWRSKWEVCYVREFKTKFIFPLWICINCLIRKSSKTLENIHTGLLYRGQLFSFQNDD